jgi:hypothetical protein
MKTLLRSALVMCAIVTGVANAACSTCPKKARRNTRLTTTAKQVVAKRTTGGCKNGQCGL